MRLLQKKTPILFGTYLDRNETNILALLARCMVAFLLTLTCTDLIVRGSFPTLPRFGANFSCAYLQRVIAGIGSNRSIVVLGDSVLWGYRLAPDRSAVSILRAQGFPLINLAFEGGSMANTYALLALMESARVHPKSVLFNVNLKVFNSADSL